MAPSPSRSKEDEHSFGAHSPDISFGEDAISKAHETASNGSVDSQSAFYSSDDNSKEGSLTDSGTMRDANGKKISRRHYLPSDELERIRKRERDAKRKQREKQKLGSGSDRSMVSVLFSVLDIIWQKLHF